MGYTWCIVSGSNLAALLRWIGTLNCTSPTLTHGSKKSQACFVGYTPALTWGLNIVTAVERDSRPGRWRRTRSSEHRPLYSLSVGPALLRSPAVTVGGGTSSAQKELSRHCTILPWMYPWTTILREMWMVTSAAQNALTE